MSSTRRTLTRHKSGCCWTCTLRRKKCDGEKPACFACKSRNITCHGFGNRPEWLDSEDRKRVELKKIKDAVKLNRKRRRTDATEDRDDEDLANNARPTFAQNIATDPYQIQSDEDPMNEPSEMLEPCPDLSAAHYSPPIYEQGSSQTPSIAQTPMATTYFRFGYHREAELLMHYLDHVFALQFRFHTPSVANGGRGWLLWLLTETKPLYHAALSLGALHQHSLLARSAQGQRYHDTLSELNEHHSRALQELQKFLQSSYEVSTGARSGRKRRLQILACGVQFISFELFRGGKSQWQVHLDALATVVRGMTLGSMEDDASPVDCDPGTPSGREPHRLESNAEHFLVGAVLWFDVMSCASTNEPPRLHAEALDLLQGQIDLANIIGCQPWVTLAVGDIAALSAWKTEAISTSSLSFWKLFEQGHPIRKRLKDGIASLRAEIDESFAALGLSHLGTMGAYLVLTNPGVQQEAFKRAITLVFAHAAQVYLDTVISGADPKLDDVRNSVIDTMNALQELRFICDAQALRNLIWPICIAGSMAEDVPTQSYFQGLIQDLGEEAHAFGNTTDTLRIMQKCWASRAEDGSGSWDWATAMESLGQCVLLV
ncbi:hypothetical protein M436DRAFT_55574 [Aureobasidium namibiae CBS 147.97]|uniref:Zn(2)-C6 fungal-type domain-containing protein n=1 Tax=Aureobasidium namibiae CBS 147.97 TaxID=1043004 RepID=A0A074W943_9PEZI|nr:uncharacterized protein M436DRAFT_55574 [Aureobasidium namibiae CBS 147.97]KEQ69600.1 hypothetical protein M436DRAFT_55574 [Aureobasidium namibiae CBS 147.97]